MTNILNWPHWNIVRVDENAHDYRVTTTLKDPPNHSPKCGHKPPFKKYGTRQELFADLPSHGKRVRINVIRQRYRCDHCQKVFEEPLYDVVPEFRATERLIEYVEGETLRRTFVSVADDTGLSERTVRRIFHEKLIDLSEDREPITPRWLGLDEIHLLGKPRAVITNLREHTMLDLLRNRDKLTVGQWLMGLDRKHVVEVVCTDMWRPYQDLAGAIFPQAVRVIDKFHIVRMADEAMENVRKSVRAEQSDKRRRKLVQDRFILLRRANDLTPDKKLILDAWLGEFPTLGDAYTLKEAFHTIFDLTDRKEAEAAYDDWRAQLTSPLLGPFGELVTAMTNWRDEVFNYFDTRVTNAYTESLNNLTKLADRVGRGYSFEVIRGKMLYGLGQHKPRRPGYTKHGWPDVDNRAMADSDPGPTWHGQPLSTLIADLEAGLP